MADRLSGRKTGLRRALNSSLDSRGTRQNWIGATELKLSLTSQTKQLQHHLPPRASTAWSLSRMDFLHRLHFGSRRRTWQGSQYGWPRKTVNPSKSPSPLNASSPEKPMPSDHHVTSIHASTYPWSRRKSKGTKTDLHTPRRRNAECGTSVYLTLGRPDLWTVLQ